MCFVVVDVSSSLTYSVPLLGLVSSLERVKAMALTSPRWPSASWGLARLWSTNVVTKWYMLPLNINRWPCAVLILLLKRNNSYILTQLYLVRFCHLKVTILNLAKLQSVAQYVLNAQFIYRHHQNNSESTNNLLHIVFPRIKRMG